jgi:hypothetical protein
MNPQAHYRSLPFEVVPAPRGHEGAVARPFAVRREEA